MRAGQPVPTDVQAIENAAVIWNQHHQVLARVDQLGLNRGFELLLKVSARYNQVRACRT